MSWIKWPTWQALIQQQAETDRIQRERERDYTKQNNG